ncbi:hypothetical protein [Streptomyces sp. NBC_00996]|uniref:hypothetical protein n=1 Tax=Streptomyces sp. NBC_00996 TaxID=2903710 RepID=UPI003864E462|nr:hypothetical protein OG390_17140 [Streptomyces sp. NBC_00996]
MKISKVWKAVVAAAAAGSAAAATAVQDGTVTTAETVTIALAVLGAYGVTWKVPNREPKDSV